MSKTPEEIKNSVLEKIRRGDVHMRPKIYFMMQVITVAVVAVLAFVASAFAMSFAWFSIHESGELFLLGFGTRGLLTFLALFPWFSLIVAVALVIFLEWLLRHFKFSYRKPILYIFFAIVLAAFAIGLFISATPLHPFLLDKADRNELPFFGGQYENVRMPHENEGEFRGVIISISTSTITISHNDNDTDADDGVRTVILPASFDISRLHVGDRIYAAGDMASGTISAYGLQKF